MTGGHPPDGYREAMVMSDSLHGFVCVTCGAVVARSDVGTHTGWHKTLITVDDVAPRRSLYRQEGEDGLSTAAEELEKAAAYWDRPLLRTVAADLRERAIALRRGEVRP